MKNMHRCLVFLLLPFAALVATPAQECGIFLAQNPITGHEEKVWPVHDGHDFEIHWAEKIAGQWANEFQLTDNLVDDSCAHFDFFGDGSTGVAWRQGGETARILYRGRSYDGGTATWQSDTTLVSDGIYDASSPRVAVHGSTLWIGWHEDSGGGGTRVMSFRFDK